MFINLGFIYTVLSGCLDTYLSLFALFCFLFVVFINLRLIYTVLSGCLDVYLGYFSV